ncbi:hypothetical protein UFOVP1244_46 [uncultured Caudovirales phage]|uniref:Uncharacterized protein n=1 Tax=uncultured Caudovirales phage TaxID=2100421 RepID=A0A6J5R6X7_9CAUD|nr:hypothetical protein UFOVP1244_46 [uncultured Caudovirales phage]
MPSDISSSNWRDVDASNVQPAPDGAPEQMFPSGVNNTMRAMMGATKRFWQRINGTTTATINGNDYTVPYSVPAPSLVSGEIFTFRAPSANTGPANLNVGIGGSRPIVKQSTTGTVPLDSSDIVTGAYIMAAWDSVSSQFVAVNIPAVSDNTIRSASAVVYASLQSVSACLTSEIRSASGAIKADMDSVSAFHFSALHSVSACLTSEIRSASGVLETHINLVSAAVSSGGTDASAAIRSTSLVIKADMDSVSAAHIAALRSVSACITGDIRSASVVIKTDISSVSSIIKADIGSVSAAIRVDMDSVSAFHFAAMHSVSACLTSEIRSASSVVYAALQSVSACLASNMALRLPVAWGSFGGATPSLSHFFGFNFLSVTRSGGNAGIYRVRFINSIDTTRGMCITALGRDTTIYMLDAGTSALTNSTSYIKLQAFNVGETSASDDSYVAFTVFANGLA